MNAPAPPRIGDSGTSVRPSCNPSLRARRLAAAAAASRHRHFGTAAMNDRRLLLAAGLAAAAMPALVLAVDREVRGSGTIVAQSRTVSGFDRIAVGGPFQVELRQGSVEAVELSGDDNLLALVETRVETRRGSKTLAIEPAKGVDLHPSRPIRIRVDLIRLAGIALESSGEVSGNSLRSPDLDIAVAGSGTVTLSSLEATRVGVSVGGSGRIVVDGRATSARVAIGGSGRTSLARLAAEEVSVNVAGSGTAEVQANQRLKITIAGSGVVVHSGAAVPTVSIAGSGAVRRG
jgi:hypothetical protein